MIFQGQKDGRGQQGLHEPDDGVEAKLTPLLNFLEHGYQGAFLGKVADSNNINRSNETINTGGKLLEVINKTPCSRLNNPLFKLNLELVHQAYDTSG